MSSVASLRALASTLVGDEAARDAEVLLCAALDRPRSYLFAWPDADVPAAAEARYRRWIEARRAGQPVAYLLGRREFWSLSLRVSAATLIPRPETELLVECALALGLPADATVADLGTGSGAIALALASERPHWQLCAVDSSADALLVARENARELGLGNIEFIQGHWLSGLAQRGFSLLVSNPPYLADSDPHLHQGDLRHEPRQALASGPEGLDDLCHIIATAPGHLAEGGWIALEHGYTQGAAVRTLLASAGFGEIATRRDLAGLERVSIGRLASGP